MNMLKLKIPSRFILLVFVFLNVLNGHSQCLNFLNERFPPEIIESHREISFERNKEVFINKAKEELKVKLRADMSEKILSSVKSQTSSEVVEVDDKFTSYFDAQIDIQSSSNLSYGNFDFCIDEKNRKIYGRFTIDKLKLAKANYADCLSALKGLIAEVNAVYYSGASVDATVYKKELDLLNSQKKTSIYLDSEVDVSSFEALYPDCQNAIARLSQSQVQLHYESEMGNVSDSLGMERYNYAIRSLRKLQKQFRDDPVIQEELSSAEANYKSKLKRDVLLYESNARYEMALKEIDAYCSLLSCENEIKEMKLKLQRDYFDQIFIQFENAIEKGLELEIDKCKKQIDKLKDVNLKSYLEIQNKYSDYERNKSIGIAEVLFNQRDYQGAYNSLKELEKIYGNADSEILRIKKKVGNHIVRGMIKNEKQTRPFNFTLNLGVDLFSNEVKLDSVSSFQVQNLNFAYSAGIYKLYNYLKYEEHNQGRKVKYADFIGVKFAYFDYPSTFYTGLGDTARMVPSSNYLYQLGLDGISARFLHYSFGVRYQNKDNLGLNWNRPSEYYGALGIRIGIRKINWITDLGIRTQFEGKANFHISSGLYYRLDFNRKFGRRDRLECKSKLK
jgi:hypothetical protein